MQPVYTMELTPKEEEILNTIVEKKCFTKEGLMHVFKLKRSTISRHLLNIYVKLCLPSNNMAALVWYYYNRVTVDTGFWDAEGNYIEDIQKVDKREL